jgi:DNA-binding response OmpR family regulator
MARRILLVDDEVAVLLTMKAILEISGFEVDTAASAREGKMKLRSHQYQMIITDMRMESDASGREVIEAARKAEYHPAVALLTAFPVDEADWQEMGAHHMLLKPVHVSILLEQIEQLFDTHAAKLARLAGGMTSAPAEKKKPAVKKKVAKKSVTQKVPAKKAVKKTPAKKVTKKVAAKKAVKKAPAKKAAKKRR